MAQRETMTAYHEPSRRKTPHKARTSALLLIALLAVGCGGGGGGGDSQTLPPGSQSWVHDWNHIAIDASGLDHTPVAPGENRVFG